MHRSFARRGAGVAATATSVDAFGSFADLETAAEAEGRLNVIALPRDRVEVSLRAQPVTVRARV